MLCVKAELISARLLSKEDKTDMLAGKITVESLIEAVKAWMLSGMPDYSNGHTDPYKPLNKKPVQVYCLGREVFPRKRFDR